MTEQHVMSIISFVPADVIWSGVFVISQKQKNLIRFVFVFCQLKWKLMTSKSPYKIEGFCLYCLLLKAIAGTRADYFNKLIVTYLCYRKWNQQFLVWI